ncbi:hypothetical protein C8R43DRAFT_1169856 [Mycena crocata]|nr:hypothetical protein C8R43DRAFT_1169856 [Mycena crocata]
MTSTTSSSMPTILPTTSLVAGGGGDLDDVPTASRSSSLTSSSIFSLSRGSLGSAPDLAVSDGADGPGALSAQSAHLGTLRPDSARCNALRMRSPMATAHFGSESGRAFMELIWQPRPLFPTVELAPTRFPRPDRKCIASGYPRYPLSTSPRSPSSTARFGSNCELDWFRQGYLLTFPAISPLPTRSRRAEGIPAFGRLRQSKIFHGGAFDARGNYPRHASPWFLLECSYILDSVVADWLLPRTPKSFTNVVNANFRLELVSLDFKNQLILTFESDFLLQTAKLRLNEQITFNYQRALRLLNLCGGILNFVELHRVLVSWTRLARHSFFKCWEFVPKGRDYLQINNGPLIGLPSRSCSKLKAGSLFTSTQDSDYLQICGQQNEPFNASQADAALPYIEKLEDTETILHSLQFIALQSLLNHFKVFNFCWMDSTIAVIHLYRPIDQLTSYLSSAFEPSYSATTPSCFNRVYDAIPGLGRDGSVGISFKTIEHPE